MEKPNKQDDVDFSLVLGGLLYKFYLKTGLVKRPLLLYKRRILVTCLFAWLPLFILAIFTGVAFGGVKLPFIYDIDVHVRFLISLALLLFAEVIAHEQLKVIVQQFLKCNIISPANRQQFYSIIHSTKRLANSVVVEVFLILFVVSVGHLISEKYFPFGVSTWYTSKVNNVEHLTPAGYWYAFVSLPLFQFILLRWYYRMAIWYRFLWKVSRLPLQLNSLHPDRAGGLGFLARSVDAFEPLLIAHSVLLAGMIINRILNAGATLTQFKGEMTSILIFLIILPLAPMMFFILSLLKTKRNGTLEYDVVANRYVNDFREKWIDTKPKNSEALLGTPDIQSLADLSNSFGVSAQMRVIPFSKNSVLTIVILTALPLLPLVLTVIPLEKIISQTIGIIF
jgi:hypothetical protein